MTKESRERAIREVLAAVEREDIEALLAHLDPEVEWFPPEQGTLDDVYRGHQGIRRLFAQLFDSWASIVHEPAQFVHDGDRIVLIAKLRLEGKSSHLAVNEEWGYLVEFTGDTITSVRMYTDPNAALRREDTRVGRESSRPR